MNTSVTIKAKLEPVTAQDLEIIAGQIGREPRDVLAVAARCRCGAPAVIVTKPLLENGTPFPTYFYLTHPDAVKAASRLEAAGIMDYFNQALQTDEQLKQAYQLAHAQYLIEREQYGKVPQIDNISAGGMPMRVKCLHALVGHALAVGTGVNPIGDEALKMMANEWSLQTCRCNNSAQGGGLLTKFGQVDSLEKQVEMVYPVKRVAAIDCGTNTIRLLIADVPGKNGAVLDDVVRDMQVVRLGHEVDKTGIFADEALARTFEVVKKYADLCELYGVQKKKFIATSATRDAQNRDLFIARVKAELGIEPEVISGFVEANLSFTGAVGVLKEQVSEQTIVVDIGGGSTEIALGNGKNIQIEQAYSMDIGSVRLWERHLKVAEQARENNEPGWETILANAQAKLRLEVKMALDEAIQTVDISNVKTVVGVAGTVTSVMALQLGLNKYEPEKIHGQTVAIETLVLACEKMAQATVKQRLEFGFMSPGRAEVIGAGALIWAEILNRIQNINPLIDRQIFISEHDILDGIAIAASRM